MGNVIAVKEIKNMKSGLTKDKKPYTRTYFVGTNEEQQDLSISTFDKVVPLKVYEMELTEEEYEGKTYLKARVISEFKEETYVPPPPKPPPQPITDTEKIDDVVINAYRIAILFLEKSNTSISLRDLHDTAREIYNGMKELK